MAHHTDKKLQNIIKFILNYTQNPYLMDFIQSLYGSATADNLKEFSPIQLYNSAASTFELLKSKASNEIKTSYFIDDKDEEYIVLQIINQNVPFLIDSICNELKLRQIDVNLMTHTLVEVKRNNTNKFVNFAKGAEQEYVIQIHIPHRFHEMYLESTLEKINEIIQCVNLSVGDWRIMEALMQESISNLENRSSKIPNQLNTESIAFLNWLINKHFVFLGALKCILEKDKILIKSSSKLGLLKSKVYIIKEFLYKEEFKGQDFVVIRQSDMRSLVHRSSHMDIIICKEYSDKGKCIGANVFFGLFTSTVYFQSVREIPLMREKVNQVIQMYGYPETSHNCKELITALEAFPRGELLKTNIDELFNIATNIVSLSSIPRVKVFLRKDHAGKFVSCIIFIPEKKFSTEIRRLIEEIVCDELCGNVSKRYVQIGESSLTRLQLIVKLSEEKSNFSTNSAKIIEAKIVKAVSNWQDEFYEGLLKEYSKEDAIKYLHRYMDAFNLKYQSEFKANKAVNDIKFIEQAFSKNNVCFDIFIKSKDEGTQKIYLKIYSPNKELTLSSTLPLIEHLGLKAIDVETNKVILNENGDNKTIYLSHFKLLAACQTSEINSQTCEKIKDTLYRIWSKSLDDDAFNSLVITCNFNYRQVNLIRSYVRYLRQTKYPLSMDYTIQVLLDNSHLTKKIIELFQFKFDPDLNFNMSKQIDVLEQQIKDDLNAIKSVNEDRAIRSLLGVVLATLRTNYYQKDLSGNYKDYLSFKLRSSEIIDLPLPKPYAEIFVYSPRFEGNHLRGGKIARGGLRWSDRPEDFRTEVLGLMKAQMTKNSVIVPMGSKGGFIIKNVQPSDGRDEYLAEGIECYKIFLKGLLDLTDNIVNNKVVTPLNVVKYDEDDPYLVVAADKGTSTFSDYANDVSINYNYWLGDAFASGGSAGYDHKKMGITAKGGWISVIRHFEDMGIDISKQEFTCVGIGDMSGDVFGNGMILSDKIKLVAAFNHAHIFLDPNPISSESYEERKRLFVKPRSQWSDYNTALISKGGGVFDRNAKKIVISPEVKILLDIKENELAPDDLIQSILKSSVDLIWNGGIGTYVKAKSESNEQIGDKSNDNLRINGYQLRAKVVGEGGNLGFTQLGRIEYARLGGRINTDFIDNSAGVDCSDHEVNIKIAFSYSLNSKKINIEKRNKLLEKMTDQVANLVLKDNYKQTQLLTLEQHSNYSKVNSHAWLIKYLESSNELIRNIEFLPNDEELQKLINDKQNLTRPELSVLLAYAKNSALKLIHEQILPTSKYLQKYLLTYFPNELSTNFRNSIEKHSLRKEIIATVLVNDFVNMLGCTFFHQLHDESGASAGDIISAYVIVREVFDIDKCWEKIEQIDSSVPLAIKIKLFNHVQAMLGRNITWLLNTYSEIKDIDKIIDFYKHELPALAKVINKVISTTMSDELSQDVSLFNDYPYALEVAKLIENMRKMKIAFDIIYVAKLTNKTIVDSAKAYYLSSDVMYIRWLINKAKDFVPKQYLQIQALRTLVNELYNIQKNIVIEELKNKEKAVNNLVTVSKYPHKYERLSRYVKELMAGDTGEAFISKLTIAIKYLKEMVN